MRRENRSVGSRASQQPGRLRAVTIAGTTAAAAVLVATLTACSADGTDRASCAAPQVRLKTSQVRPGDSVQVSVRYLLACVDSQPSAGQPATLQPPARASIWFSQGDRRQVLATKTVGPGGTLTADVVIPQDALLGEAIVGADLAQPSRLMIASPAQTVS